MRKSVTFRRILLLTFSGIMLSALVTLSLYSVFAPSVFANAKFRELGQSARYLAEQTTLYLQSSDQYLQLPTGDVRQWGAFTYIYDKDRKLLSDMDQFINGTFYPANIPHFENLLDQVLGGEPLYTIERVPLPVDQRKVAVDLLVIGYPAQSGDEVIGAVFMVNTLKELTSATSSLLSTLWLSVLAVSMLMIPLAYWFSMLITRPIWSMRDIALRMAGGDFSVHANETGIGEISDLSKAFNVLSSRLYSSIAELTQERNQAVVIINSLNEGVLAMDRNGNLTQTNPALQNMLRATGRANIDQLPTEVWDDYRSVLIENHPIERRFPLGEMQIYLTITPISHALYGVTHAIGVFHDETEAQRLEQTRRDYVANVSHELKTPLTALRAMVEPLCDGLIHTEEKRLETYHIILRETMRLSRLVDDMLELSRLQAGQLALEKTLFEPIPLLHDIASIYAAKAAETGHTLSLVIPNEAPPKVFGNPDRTEQVLVILLNNAFTHTPPGSHIVLRMETESTFLRVIVEDNGPGISSVDLRHVFERFYKADKSHSGQTGTGLGLAIANELMKCLNEEIIVENHQEGGARFSFTLHYQTDAAKF